MRTIFHFHSGAVDPDSLKVLEFEGEEKVSGLYAYRIDLLAEDDALDLAAILGAGAYLGLERDGEQLKIHGILSDFEQLGRLSYYTHYRAVLVPRLWLMTLRRQNQIYQELTVQEIIEQELTDAGLTSDDFEFRLTNGYEAREYVAQYRETDLDFISRLMEHEGIFYFFEQQDDREKLIIADGNVAFAPIPQASPIPFRDPAGMETTDEEAVQALVCRRRRVAANVILKDYNYRNPGMQMRAEHPEPIDESLDGLISEYGDHFRTDDDGRRLAKIRAEEQAAQGTLFLGEGDCTAFRGGHFFDLTDHYRGDFDQRYLLTELRHVGRQTSPGVDGLAAGPATAGLTPDAEGTAYRNEFTAIPADVPFRPARLTPKPKLHGIMNAHVDAAGDGEYAELDDEGRYKVIVPFDLSGNGDGKASRYIRMAQPYAGPGYGMHTPLHKGTEVIWTCIDGDLDRPIIAGAVPNPQTRSPVTGGNQTQSVLRTAGRNQITLEDQQGAEMVLVQSPVDSSKLYLGTGNSSSGIHATTDGHGVFHAKSDIYLNAWPTDYWSTGDASSYINAGISAAQVVGAASAAAGAGALAFLPAVAGVAAAIGNIALPGIVASSPGGISAATPSTFTAVGIAGVGLLTPAAAEIVGAANASLMSGGGVNIYTIAGGIRIVASSGDIDIEAKSASVKTKASDNVIADAGNSMALSAYNEVDVVASEADVTLQAMKTNVELIAKQCVKVTAEEEEVLLKCGDSSISLRKDGTINITGKLVVVEGEGASLRLEAQKFELESDVAGEIKGTTLKAEASGIHTIKGAMVRINT